MKPMTRRTFVGVRLGPELDTIQTLANQETDGNLSKMIRALLVEALHARQAETPERDKVNPHLS